MSHSTEPHLLVLRAVRVLGYADARRLAARTSLGDDELDEQLLDAQAHGLVTWSTFVGDGGWSLTEAGKIQGERLLAAELDSIGARADVQAAYREFLPVNDAVADACTRWQLSEMEIGDQPVSLDATIASLSQAAHALEAIEGDLVARLGRFRGYHARYTYALSLASTDPAWITGTDRDSIHRTWFELHEDLIATLGIAR